MRTFTYKIFGHLQIIKKEIVLHDFITVKLNKK